GVALGEEPEVAGQVRGQDHDPVVHVGDGVVEEVAAAEVQVEQGRDQLAGRVGGAGEPTEVGGHHGVVVEAVLVDVDVDVDLRLRGRRPRLVQGHAEVDDPVLAVLVGGPEADVRQRAVPHSQGCEPVGEPGSGAAVGQRHLGDAAFRYRGGGGVHDCHQADPQPVFGVFGVGEHQP